MHNSVRKLECSKNVYIRYQRTGGVLKSEKTRVFQKGTYTLFHRLRINIKVKIFQTDPKQGSFVEF